MLFNSLSYLIFFPAVFLLYWLTPHRFRVPLLLVASYIFYMSWKPVYGVLLFGMTVVNYLIAFKLQRSDHGEERSPQPQVTHAGVCG